MYKSHGDKGLSNYFSSSFEEELISQYQTLSESTASDIGWSVQESCLKSDEARWEDPIKGGGLSLNDFGSFMGSMNEEPITSSKDLKSRYFNSFIFDDNPIAAVPCGLLYPIVFIGNIPPNVPYDYLRSVILSSFDTRNEEDNCHHLIALNYQPSYKEWRTAYATFKTWSCAQKVIQHLHLRRHFKNAPFHRLVACISPTPPPSVLSSSFDSAYDPQEAEQIIMDFQETNRRLIMYQPQGTEVWLPSYNRVEKSKSFFGTWNCFRRDHKMHQPPARWMQYYRENGLCEYWDSFTGNMQSTPPVSQAKEDKHFLPTTITLLRDGPGGANLFIYGIPNDWTEVTLMQLCQRFGHIVGIRLPTANNNGKLNRCFGFISYDNKPSTWAAIRSIAGIKFFGKPLKIQLKAGEDALLPLTLRPIVEGSTRNRNFHQEQFDAKSKGSVQQNNGHQISNMPFSGGCTIPRNNGSCINSPIMPSPTSNGIGSFSNATQLHCSYVSGIKQARYRAEPGHIRLNHKFENSMLMPHNDGNIKPPYNGITDLPINSNTATITTNTNAATNSNITANKIATNENTTNSSPSFSDFFRIQSTPHPSLESLENSHFIADNQNHLPEKSANLQMLLKNILIYDHSSPSRI
ncbi:bruno-like and RRM domain-containing RNA binding protein [Cryptosporidium canis]|uniref:Bruno-like and RRM domain-containing RNA binding protein n=1 Tax=Cryptosporidium canis TaxID=195482 RepID=A0ABQ8PB38_9CRYT|nr:bruno-like and RRM domain-containing RNA binding protein [Cryptosporidium canis]